MYEKIMLVVLISEMFLLSSYGTPLGRERGKLSTAEWTNYNSREPEGVGTYAFGYDIEDPNNDNVQFRNEEKLANGSIVGSYGFVESGEAFIVRYIADKMGYRATVETPLKIAEKTQWKLFKKPSNDRETQLENRFDQNNNMMNENRMQSNSSHAEKENDNDELYFPPINLNGENKKNMTNNNNTNTIEYFESEKESNEFYYPQHILQSPDFHRKPQENDMIHFENDRTERVETPREIKDSEIETRIISPEKNSVLCGNKNQESEDNSFYYPQHIINSPDFQKYPTISSRSMEPQVNSANNLRIVTPEDSTVLCA